MCSLFFTSFRVVRHRHFKTVLGPTYQLVKSNYACSVNWLEVARSRILEEKWHYFPITKVVVVFLFDSWQIVFFVEILLHYKGRKTLIQFSNKL
jgi:hypothetical protein